MAVTIVATGIVAVGYWIHDGTAELDRVAATMAGVVTLLLILKRVGVYLDLVEDISIQMT